MSGQTRNPTNAARRVLENAGILIFASLLVMSVALGRYSVALVWCGALMVFFAHTWESRSLRQSEDPSAMMTSALRQRHCGVLRWLGLTFALTGAAAMTV